MSKKLTPDPRRVRQVLETTDRIYATLRAVIDRKRDHEAALAQAKMKLAELEQNPTGKVREKEVVEKAIVDATARIAGLTAIVAEAREAERRATAEWEAAARLKTAVLAHCAAKNIKILGTDGVQPDRASWHPPVELVADPTPGFDPGAPQ